MGDAEIATVRVVDGRAWADVTELVAAMRVQADRVEALGVTPWATLIRQNADSLERGATEALLHNLANPPLIAPWQDMPDPTPRVCDCGTTMDLHPLTCATTPAHLRDDAPTHRCDQCGRTTVDAD